MTMIDIAELPTPISTDGPPVDVPLLRKAVEWAEAEAAKPVADSEWYQLWYITKGSEIGRECGTAYCIAGYVASLAGGEPVWDDLSMATEVTLDGQQTDVWCYASAALGLAENESIALFGAGRKITDVRDAAERIAARAGERL